ncbi:hypothetical protein C0J52_13429 [Blattella germanica]|nr:hypothetical protein C0J52_13429 [Blattella germanica]
MSDLEAEVGENENKGESLSVFVDILQEYKIVFTKSMLLKARKKRSAALTEIRRKYEEKLGIAITEGQFIRN